MSLFIWVEDVEILVLNVFDVLINTVLEQNMKNTEEKKI